MPVIKCHKRARPDGDIFVAYCSEHGEIKEHALEPYIQMVCLDHQLDHFMEMIDG